MERVWNKSELEQMEEWVEDGLGDWWLNNQKRYIDKRMTGQSVQWCKDNGYTVTDEMIATERLDKGENTFIVKGAQCLDAFAENTIKKSKLPTIEQFMMEIKKGK